MIDRPKPTEPKSFAEVEATFGECELIGMTSAGECGLACQKQIEPESLRHGRRFRSDEAAATSKALQSLLVNPAKPVFSLR